MLTTKSWNLKKKAGNENSPHLSVLVAEVDQAGNVEEQLYEVVQHEQDQTQTVQTGRHKEHVSPLLQVTGATDGGLH